MERRTVANPFQHMMKENWMGLARVRAPQEDDLRLLRFPVRTRSAARSENRRQTGDARGMSSPVTAINVVRTDYRAHEFLRDVIQFVGRLRTTKHAERAGPMLLDLCPESRSHAT